MGINVSLISQNPESKYCQFCVNLSHDSVGRKRSMLVRRQKKTKTARCNPQTIGVYFLGFSFTIFSTRETFLSVKGGCNSFEPSFTAIPVPLFNIGFL